MKKLNWEENMSNERIPIQFQVQSFKRWIF